MSETPTDERRSPASSRALIARLWRTWLRPRAGGLALATGLMAVVAFANTLYPVAIQWAGRALETPERRVLLLIPLAIIALTAFKAAALLVQVVVTQRLVLRVLEDMQNALFGRLLRADFQRIQSEPAGALAARFTNDVNVAREALTRAATHLVRDALTILGAAAFLFYVDWLLALLLLGVYPLAFAPIVRIGEHLRRTSAHAQEQTGRVTALLNETFGGARMVKTYGLEAYERERARAAFEERYELQARLAVSKAGVEPILEVLGGLAFAGVLAFAGWRAMSGRFDVADLIAVIAAIGIMAPAVRALGTLNGVAQEGLAAVERIFAVMDEDPKIVDAPGAPALTVGAGGVRLDAVSFSYPDGTEALTDVSIVLEPGTVTALVGPSGGGKSTILNLIPRLYDADAGGVLIDDTDVRAVTLASLRSQIALVSQDVTLFDDTVRANIAFGRADASDADIRAAAEAAAALDFIEELSDGFDTVVGERGSKLSGGQRQRIALARAVLKDAPILLLDEATSALDAESEAKVQDALDRLARGRTTLVIAHRLSTVREADKIYVLAGGRVVEDGTDETLKDTPEGLYARLRALQFAGDALPATSR